MATLSTIKKRIDETKDLYTKKLKSGKILKGTVRRKDILDVLNHHKDFEKEKENVKKFLDTLDPEIIDHERKVKILNDLDSYIVSYKRKKK